MNELQQILGIQLPKNIKISSVVNTTDKVIKDSIFFGLQGTRVHGSKYADKALELGASLVIHNDPDFISKHKNIFYIKDLHDKLVLFLDAFYNIDINSNNFYAFTGTNGKTSAAYLTHQLLQKMNYKIYEKENEIFFKYNPPKKFKKIPNKKISKESPFKILKNLNFS